MQSEAVTEWFSRAVFDCGPRLLRVGGWHEEKLMETNVTKMMDSILIASAEYPRQERRLGKGGVGEGGIGEGGIGEGGIGEGGVGKRVIAKGEVARKKVLRRGQDVR